MRPDLYRKTIKRWMDVAAGLVGLILASPVLLVAAIVVRLDSPGPVWFVQPRLGQDGRIFRAYKLRTMTHKPRVPTREIYGRDPEVTRAGYWLRRFKIDELPQFLNVLKGDMSLVGPRPALPSQLAEYDETSRRRLLVRPGLTGLAQINGSTYLSWPQRWVYDVEYVDRLSLATDLSILWRTMAVVLIGEEHFRKPPRSANPPAAPDGQSTEPHEAAQDSNRSVDPQSLHQSAVD